MRSSIAVVFALAASAFGTVFVTSPTASTTFNGGTRAEVTWIDDGRSPSLTAFGDASLSIYVGNAQQQTLLQTIVPKVNVGNVSAVQFIVDASIGPNSSQYFIRVESLELADPAQPQYPALAFSSKFTLASMTGTFNASVQAQIDGQSTAPIGGTPAASGTTARATTTGASSSRAASSGGSTASAAQATRSSGASPLSASSSFGALVGVLAFFGLAL